MDQQDNQSAFPAQLSDYWVARVTMHGGDEPFTIDTLQVEDLLREQRDLVESQFDRPPGFRDFEGRQLPIWGVVGIFPTAAEASRALDVYEAWRRGS